MKDNAQFCSLHECNKPFYGRADTFTGRVVCCKEHLVWVRKSERQFAATRKLLIQKYGSSRFIIRYKNEQARKLRQQRREFA